MSCGSRNTVTANKIGRCFIRHEENVKLFMFLEQLAVVVNLGDRVV